LVQTHASIGVAMAGPDHTAPELLIRDADFAMYRAKQVDGSHYEIFDKHMEVCFSSQQEREQELRQALEKREFEFLYQPVYRLDSGKLDGFESVLHLRRPDGTRDSSNDLLVMAEDTGMSIALIRETLDAVCWQLRSWTDAVPQSNITLSVNLTHRQFYLPDLVEQLKRTLAASGVDPSRLLFEVPETALNENPDAAVAILQRMVDCNVRVAVDDFGSGLGSLNHLVHLPISRMKLAPMLTVSATSPGRQQAVLESIIHLGRTLGVQVVAQGIETPEHLQALGRMGCELGQGPLLSPPLEQERALRLAYGLAAPLA
jgi:EAL domain-containing protein (putative c-di-GMP-specific phosphodiesterase class I)